VTRVAAFDPSYVSGRTGYAVVEGDRLIIYGTILLTGGCDSERFASLQREVEALCLQFNIDKGVVERPPAFSYTRSTGEDGKPLNLSAILKNSAVATIILASLGRLGIRTVEADAHRWKIYRGINLGKDEIKRLIELLFPQLKGRRLSSHVAEAICMAAMNQ
jgi:hypothetical protein